MKKRNSKVQNCFIATIIGLLVIFTIGCGIKGKPLPPLEGSPVQTVKEKSNPPLKQTPTTSSAPGSTDKTKSKSK